jgi:hypothetical protein
MAMYDEEKAYGHMYFQDNFVKPVYFLTGDDHDHDHDVKQTFIGYYAYIKQEIGNKVKLCYDLLTTKPKENRSVPRCTAV